MYTMRKNSLSQPETGNLSAILIMYKLVPFQKSNKNDLHLDLTNGFSCFNIKLQIVELWFLMPLSTIFQLYMQSVLLVEETGVPGESH